MRLREKTNLEICKENNLNSVILTNVVDEKISRNKIRAALEIIAKALSSTLGPDGATTIIQNPQLKHLVTKDGLDVVSKITFQDEIARTILDMIRSISSNQVLAVGDGSTSTIVVANAMYQEFTAEHNKEKFKYVSPKVIVDMLNTIAEYVEKKLPEEAIPLSDDYKELKKIASVAMNNDDAIGDIITEIYQKIGKYGFISTDISENYESDSIEYKKGISWERGYIDPVFGERYDGNRVVHKKPKIFLTDGTINIVDCDNLYGALITKICGDNNQDLVIVANYITDEATNWFYNVRQTYKINKKELRFTVVDIDQVTNISKNRLRDLSLLCGCRIYNNSLNKPEEVTIRLENQYTRDDKYEFIGEALTANITARTTDIICDDSLLTEKSLKIKDEAIAEITKSLDELNRKSLLKSNEINDTFEFKQRLSNLQNLTAIFHVGGKTFQERESRERLIEDAIFASKSAINYGYVVGGNVIIPKIINKYKSEVIQILLDKFYYLEQDAAFFEYFLNMFINSFLASYRAVLENSQILTEEKIQQILNKVLNEDLFFNLKTHKYESFKETSIINSMDTDLQILKSCVSLIGLLATSNQVITLNCNIEDQVR